MIERIDHVVAVAEDFGSVRRAWLETGCPIVWDGRVGDHADCAFSIGPINLEILSREAFDGWPALTERADRVGRTWGIQAVAFNPGNLDTTVAELRATGLEPTQPRPGRLNAAPAEKDVAWRNSYLDGLSGLLPGSPSFLCEFTAPRPHLGRASPNSPIRFVELEVAVADPEAVVEAYERVLNVRPDRAGSGYRLPLDDTPLRLIEGDGFILVLEPRSASLHLQALSAALPGIHWAEGRLAPRGFG